LLPGTGTDEPDIVDGLGTYKRSLSLRTPIEGWVTLRVRALDSFLDGIGDHHQVVEIVLNR